jgi:hypothetical protein
LKPVPLTKHELTAASSSSENLKRIGAEAIAISRSFLERLQQVDEMTVKVLAADRDEAGADALTIMSALFERDWRVVHVAGHGEPPELQLVDGSSGGSIRDVNPRGVVLSDGVYLGPREFASMPQVPEMVFINCCHLPSLPPASEQRTWSGAYSYSRASFAAAMAEALLAIGVRCVVVAGCAVDDTAATIFAERFYGALARGQRFRDAVTDARQAVFNLESTSTWGAYQCYGNGDWTLLD